MKTAEELCAEWRRGDSFIGTGFACGHYRKCAIDAVESGEATAETALEAYDLATEGMDRWNEFHRPKFGEDLAVENRWNEIRKLTHESAREAERGSSTEFLMDAAVDYLERGDYRRVARALKFASIQTDGPKEKIERTLSLLAENGFET